MHNNISLCLRSSINQTSISKYFKAKLFDNNLSNVEANHRVHSPYLEPVETIIGDHSLVVMSLRNEKRESPVVSYRRDWSKYSKEKLVSELLMVNMKWEIDDVQSLWNKIETG